MTDDIRTEGPNQVGHATRPAGEPAQEQEERLQPACSCLWTGLTLDISDDHTREGQGGFCLYGTARLRPPEGIEELIREWDEWVEGSAAATGPSVDPHLNEGAM